MPSNECSVGELITSDTSFRLLLLAIPASLQAFSERLVARDLHRYQSCMTGTFAEFERVWVTAVQERDLGSLDVLLDKDFLCTSWASDGELINKEQYLAAVQNEDIRNCSAHDFSIQQAGDTVVVKCKMSCEFGQRGISSELLVTDTWVRRRNRWKVLARHTSVPFSTNLHLLGTDGAKA